MEELCRQIVLGVVSDCGEKLSYKSRVGGRLSRRGAPLNLARRKVRAMNSEVKVVGKEL